MPVEITGAWLGREKGIGGRIVLGWFAPGSFGGTQGEPFGPGEAHGTQKPRAAQDKLKPRPTKERRRADPAEERNPRAQPGIIPQKTRDGTAVAVPHGGAAPGA